MVYHVMTKSNLFRDRLHGLIIGTDEESVRFKEQVASLSVVLDKYPLPSVENQLSFSRVCVENNPDARMTGNKKVEKFTCTSRFDNTLPVRWILEVLRNSGTQILGITSQMLGVGVSSEYILSIPEQSHSRKDFGIARMR